MGWDGMAADSWGQMRDAFAQGGEERSPSLGILGHMRKWTFCGVLAHLGRPSVSRHCAMTVSELECNAVVRPGGACVMHTMHGLTETAEVKF